MILALSAGRDAPAELRARLTLDEAGQRKLLRAERKGIGEIVVLCTCHRTEIYATADGPSADALHEVAAMLPDLRATDQHDLRSLEGSAAIEHLFRVACGLDSLVIGEPQVLAQVRKAYVLGQDEGTAGPVLSTVFGRAMKLGKRARTETALAQLSSSIGQISADYLAARLHGWQGLRGVIIGAGEGAEDAARSLVSAGASLVVISRTLSSAQKLADEFGAASYSLDDFSEVVAKSDFAVVAISGGPVLKSSQFPRDRELFPVIDLSVPAAVEIDTRDGVEIHTLEDLPGPRGPEITAAVIDAEAMVRKEVAELERWVDSRASGPSIRELREWAEGVARQEIARSLAGLDLNPAQRERVEASVMRIVGKLIHEPTKALREADAETRSLIQRLFGLEI